LQKDNKDLLRVIDERDIDIHNLKAEIAEDQEIIKKQEKKIVSIPVLEHKVRALEKDFATNLHHIKSQHKEEVTDLKRVLGKNNDHIQDLQRQMASSPNLIKASLKETLQWGRATMAKPSRTKSKSFFPNSPARLLVSPTPNSAGEGVGLSIVRTPLSSRSKLS
jgi:chromosome segregation ATPase